MDKATSKQTLSKLPTLPGVYIFWPASRDKQKKSPIYIGKAKNLKNRVESYFANQLARKTARMVGEAENISFIKVDSELAALLLEATLIKKYQPKYNSAAKDDKHPLYIKIAKETYPRVITARRANEKNSIAFFGPFPSSSNVRSALRMLRRIFPFSDHKIGKRGCLYSQIGECNPCPSKIEKIKNQKLKRELTRKYLWNIRIVKKVLSGNIEKVFNELRKDMEKFSKEEKFEEAARVREQIKRLEYITQPIIPSEYFLQNPNLTEDLRKNELKEFKNLLAPYFSPLTSLSRIECYDVAHLAGTNPTASMVTFINGEADKTYYRHFRIRQNKGRDDLASLEEVAKRRAKYFEAWGRPNLTIVDGGKGQVKVFQQAFLPYGIPVVGIAKKFETLVVPEAKVRPSQGPTLSSIRLKRGPALNLVQRIRDEAHRFARRYHHKLLRKSFIP